MKQLASLVAVVFWCAVAGFANQRQIQVAGVVRSATTGEAVKSASVVLRSSGAQQNFSRTTTGPDGSFGFSGLAPGQYQLTVGKPGYQSFQANAPVTILPDSTEATSLAPALWPNGAIGGRVVDWDGEPVSEAEVRAYAVVYAPAGATLSLAAKGETDDQGAYRLFDLPAGKYVLQVSPSRKPSPSGQFYAETPAAYYPGAPTPSQALPIELNWGAGLERADVTLSRGQSFAIAGAVWDAAAEGPCVRCLVEAVQHDSLYRVSLPQTARVSRDGAFVLRGLPSGDYTLVVRQGSSDGPVAQTSASIRNRHVEDARLVVGLQQTVTGEIVLENPPQGIDATDWMPQLSPLGVPEWWPRAEGKVHTSLQFTIDGASPARYRFELSGLPPGAYVKALRAGGQPLTNPEILVPAEAPVSGLQAVVSFDGATVQGKVRSSDSTQNATSVQARVFLLPQNSQAGLQLPKTGSTTPDGGFSLASVAPGSYTLYALPSTTALQIFDPAVQAALGKYARQVDLNPKETANVEVVLAPPLR